MRLLLATVAVLIISAMIPAFGQQEYQIVKSDSSESFAFPYTAGNRDIDDPLVYTYDVPKGPSWIMTINNSMSYVARDEAKTIVKIQEPAPSEKYIEIAMYGGESRRYWVAVNTPEVGYARMYDNNENGWLTDGPISVTYGENTGLTVTNGKRIVVDRLDLNGFSVGSIAVYGKDEPVSLANVYAGDMTFEVLFGSFKDSPLYIVPAVVMIGVGSLVAGLLVLKKRKPSD
jgi:hypothetical protein